MLHESGPSLNWIQNLSVASPVSYHRATTQMRRQILCHMHQLLRKGMLAVWHWSHWWQYSSRVPTGPQKSWNSFFQSLKRIEIGHWCWKVMKNTAFVFLWFFWKTKSLIKHFCDVICLKLNTIHCNVVSEYNVENVSGKQ